MKTTTRLLLIACLALPFAACKKEEAPQKVEAAPLTAPTTTDDAAWQAYLTDVVKRNMEGINASPYVYYLPQAADTPEFQAVYQRQLEKTESDLARGIIEGNMLAFGSPSSAKMADMIVDAFDGVDAASMKGVRVVFIGDAADNARVQAAVTPSGVEYKFVEAK